MMEGADADTDADVIDFPCSVDSRIIDITAVCDDGGCWPILRQGFWVQTQVRIQYPVSGIYVYMYIHMCTYVCIFICMCVLLKTDVYILAGQVLQTVIWSPHFTKEY